MLSIVDLNASIETILKKRGDPRDHVIAYSELINAADRPFDKASLIESLVVGLQAVMELSNTLLPTHSLHLLHIQKILQTGFDHTLSDLEKKSVMILQIPGLYIYENIALDEQLPAFLLPALGNLIKIKLAKHKKIM